jgi:eukaryotic-like serine/threonine-protein kinase
MKPSAADWPDLLRLLEQAQARDEASLPGWLASLPQPRQQQLRALLEQRRSIETRQFLEDPARLPPLAGENDSAVSPGQRVGPWRLLHELGRGGMAWVWLAERADGQGQRRVALKLPRIGWAAGLAERMVRERDLLVKLEHPHIARLYDAGVDELGRPWLALEYVQGQPIDRHCGERGLDTRARIELLIQALEAVGHAHAQQVLHRDLKPANILVAADGGVRLLDFGIGKLMHGDTAESTQLTQASGRALTPAYASPEQVQQQVLSAASDIYSMGVVAYELLAGARPYTLRRGTAAELEEAIARAHVAAPSRAATNPEARRALRGDLDAVLLKALQQDAAARYATAHQFAQDLRRVLAGQPVSAAPDSWWYRGRKLVQRRPLESALVAALVVAVPAGAAAQVAVLLALGAGTAATLWQARRAREQARVAQHQARRAEQVKELTLALFRTTGTDAGAVAETKVADLLRQAGKRLESSAEAPADVLDELRLVVADSLGEFGAPNDALPLARQALAGIERRLPPAPDTLADALCTLGGTLTDTNGAAEAVELLQRGLALPCDARRWVRLRCKLFTALHALGRQRDGLPFAQEAAARAEAEPEAVGRLQAMHAFGVLTFACKSTMVMGMLPASQRALSLAQSIYGRDAVAPLVLYRIYHAAALVQEGDAFEGVRQFRALIDELRQALGPHHPRVAVNLNWLLLAEDNIGDIAAALRNQEQMLAMPGREHEPPVRRSIDHFLYARLLHKAGRDEEALREIACACTLVDEGGSAMLAKQRETHAFHALLLLRCGQPQQAAAIYRSLPDTLQDWPTPAGKVWVAEFRVAQQRYDEALQALHAALPDLIAQPPLSSGVTIGRAALLALACGQAPQAWAWAQEAMARLGSAQLESSPVLADLHALAGRIQQRLGNPSQARVLLQEARRRWALFDAQHARLAALSREIDALPTA